MKKEILAVILFVICFILWAWRLNWDINWINCLTTLLAAGLGSWTAYVLNLRQQEQLDKQYKEEESKKQRDKQILQLNYLQTYLHFYADELYSCYQKLQGKQQLYIKIKQNNYQLSNRDWDDVSIVFADLSSKFESNWKDLSFTNNDPLFIYTLAKLETAIQRFNKSHSFGIENFGKNIDELRQVLGAPSNVDQALVIKSFIKKQEYNNGEEIFLIYYAVSTLDEMIRVFTKYAKANGYKFVENNKKEEGLSILSYSKHVKEFIEEAKTEIQRSPK